MTSPQEEQDAKLRNRYLRGQVKPRLSEILWTWRAWAPISLGVAIGLLVPTVATIDVKITEVATVGINYSALSFGATITGSVLAISLPSQERIRRWASARYQNNYFSRYSHLVFTLTWAATAQLAVLFVSITAVVIGGDEDIVPRNAYVSHRILLGLSLAVFLYAIMQLLILVGTISQLGNLIDFGEWKAQEREARNNTSN